MVKQIILPLLAVAAVVVAVGLFMKNVPQINIPGAHPAASSSTTAKTLTLGTKIITVEIANTDATRAKGLGGRTFLDPKDGMLFVFDEKGVTPEFWMKDMLIPLDIIWISNGKVVKIDKDIKPPKAGTPDSKLVIYSAGQPIDYVLEVMGGFSDNNNIKVGDPVVLPTL